jgi:hypothetical protein
MSAIGYYCSVEKVKGKEGEDRVVIIMNGKFLPHVEQVKYSLFALERCYSWEQFCALLLYHCLGRVQF